MKLSLSSFLYLTASVIPCYSALTKGYIQVKGPSWAKPLNISTVFDRNDGSLYVSENGPALLVQLDLERAQTVESDIEAVNGYWTPDLYPYIGVFASSPIFLTENTQIWFTYVSQTPDALPKQLENAYSAVCPNPVELSYQASAVWKYDPNQGGKLKLTFVALNGTRLPAMVWGDWYKGNFRMTASRPSETREAVDFYFVPATE